MAIRHNPTKSISSTYTILPYDYSIKASGGSYNITLPAINDLDTENGTYFWISNADGNPKTILPTGAAIEGLASLTLEGFQTVYVYLLDSNWRVMYASPSAGESGVYYFTQSLIEQGTAVPVGIIRLYQTFPDELYGTHQLESIKLTHTTAGGRGGYNWRLNINAVSVASFTFSGADLCQTFAYGDSLSNVCDYYQILIQNQPSPAYEGLSVMWKVSPA